jgi:hypothetical protein
MLDNEAQPNLQQAENILLQPDMLSRAAGIEPTPRPLQHMLISANPKDFDAGLNVLVALAQGPNGNYRRIAVLAIGEIGFAPPKMFEFLEFLRENEKAPDVLRAIGTAVALLRNAT